MNQRVQGFPSRPAWLLIPEKVISVALLALMALIPVWELVGRKFFGKGLVGSVEYLRHITLWVGFFGAMLASRTGDHLKIAVLDESFPPRFKKWTGVLTGSLGTLICLGLLGSTLALLSAEAPALSPAWIPVVNVLLPGPMEAWLEAQGLYETWAETMVAGWLPTWIAESVMALGFLMMAVRSALRSGATWALRIPALLAFPVMAWAPFLFSEHAEAFVLPGIVILFLSALIGLPIFMFIGGSALLLFWGDYVPTASIPAEIYRIVSSPVFPTIPLFTLAGFILSESRASVRLVEVFRAWFGWMPGGLPIAAAVSCAFFTTFTGASGVTILALGGVLFPVLLKSGCSEKFSLGLITASGSLGLLLPPSLVVILFAVFARIPVTDMFIGGLVPGNLLILPVLLYCVWVARREGFKRDPFSFSNAWKTVYAAKWEMAMPVLVVVLLFGGFCTLVEAAAGLVLYCLFIEAVLYRDFTLRRLAGVFVNCSALNGAVLIILGVAMGLTSYLVDAQVPQAAAEWVSGYIHSKTMFLVCLNLALIVAGCLMDIFSALVVLVPIVVPMAEHYDVDMVHLGVIFLANLQLGYLTPPVGMNLFLSAMRFKKPLFYVSRAAVPFMLLLALVVVLVTFVPALSKGVVDLVR